MRKEKKLYLWDWSHLKKPGARLENLVASHLLKVCHYWHDCEGWDVELFCFQDKLKIPFSYQVTQNGEKDFLKDGIRILPVQKFLAAWV